MAGFCETCPVKNQLACAETSQTLGKYWSDKTARFLASQLLNRLSELDECPEGGPVIEILDDSQVGVHAICQHPEGEKMYLIDQAMVDPQAPSELVVRVFMRPPTPAEIEELGA